jgi:serine protease Do
MRRVPASVLCAAALFVGIIIGASGEWWSFSRPVQANLLDQEAARRLAQELRDGTSALHTGSDLLSKIAKLTSPSVVHIQCERRNSKRGLVEETGSGVIVVSEKSKGIFVVTNRHVVDATELGRITIHLADGRVLHPMKVWSDKFSDVAIMKIEAPSLNAARWGDSDRLEIGHMVLAMGSPFGLSQSLTYGIVSAKGRRALQLGETSDTELINQDFLQTDAAINPGNSGGPLINLHGEIVGINTAIASNSGGNEGIGFSIPSNLVRRVVDDLLAYGKVPRAWLGVVLDPDFKPDTARRLKLDRLRGARVVKVFPDSPAARANMQFDDVVLQFDGHEVLDENHLINLVSLLPVNKRVKALVWRGGRHVNMEVTVTDRTELDERAEAPIKTAPGMGTRIDGLGLTVHELEPDLALQLGFPKAKQGLLVLNVDSRSPVAGDLQLYDLIEEVARTPVNTASELRAAVRQIHHGESIVLKVQRSSDGQKRSHLVVVRW